MGEGNIKNGGCTHFTKIVTMMVAYFSIPQTICVDIVIRKDRFNVSPVFIRNRCLNLD